MVIGVRRCLDNMTTLSAELSRFSSCSKRLQLILDETKRIFNDINESGKSEDGKITINGQFFSVELLKEEEQEIVSIAQKPLGIIVLGQNAYCKSKIVNSIFNRTIFPTFDETDNNGNFRLVRFKFGDNLSISLALPDDYDLVNNLEAYKGPWNTIPRKDIEIESKDESDSALDSAVLEVSFNHVLLRQGTRVIVAPSVKGQDTEEIYLKCFDGVSPILIYGYQTETLTQKDLLDLEVLYSASHYQPVCFVKVPLPGQLKKDTNIQNGAPSYLHKHKYDSPLNSNVLDNATQTGADHDTEASHMTHTSKSYEEPQYCVTPPCGYGSTVTVKRTNVNVSSSNVFHQLCDLGYLSETADGRSLSRSLASNYYEVDSEIVEDFDQFPSRFMNFAQQVIQMYLVNSSSVLNNSHARCLNMFILSAFDMAREMLITPKKLEFAREKEEELYKSLMKISVEKGDEIKAMISETIHGMQEKLIHKAVEYEFLGVEFTENGEILTTKGLKICTYQIQELVLGALNQAIAGNLVKSVDILRDSYTGTLSRCLESLERLDKEQNPEGNTTSKALKQIINAAYQVEIHLQSSYSFIRVLLERMKQLVKSLPWSTQPIIDNEWKAKAAIEMLSSLSEARLARSITSQIKDRLNKSHDAFAVALKQLEQKHSGRLDKIEEERLKLRKVHAPRVAKVALESISLKDVILHGMPQMGREIGRGQYGVVYSCDSWSGFSPCAIKSVVPPDDKHWNDLALEFYYTKNIPEHERIVVLRGSVIDYMYGGGTTPAVLLIMDRLQRDLYAAIKQGLDWAKRLQVSIDVVEGIRYLHSQGLVHRDIKLKNVLLDQNCRGKITDLGFCKPEAMMSGSIVGTPIHMAPELFTGRYDNSVDVYAFGILFWYVCAGHVKLPNAFEQCTNKDQLWTNVKKGLRPEKLATFDSECWELMQECWEGEPMKRPLLGDVETRLKHILMQYRKSAKATSQPPDVKNTNSSRRIMPAIPKIMDKR